MGIDVYLKPKNQTEEEREAQLTGFSIVDGHNGYLREAYHGGPYATQILLPECWEEEGMIEESEKRYGYRIPVEKLKERLPYVMLASLIRHYLKYENSEQENNDLDLAAALARCFGEMQQRSTPEELVPLLDSIPGRTAVMILDEVKQGKRELPNYVQSYVDFVALVEKYEEEGRDPLIYASY